MRLHIVRTIILAGAVLALPTVAMADAVIKKNHMKVNGLRYYKANAHNVTLGDWGDKKTPVTQANYLEQKGSFKSAVKAVTVSRFKMSQAGATQANVIGNVKVPALGLGLSGNDLFKKLKSGQYEFMEIAIRNKVQKFRNDANKQKGKINQLKQSDKHRIVSSIIVVISGSEAQKMGLSHQGKFNGTWNGVKLVVQSDVKSVSARTYTPGAGNVYAYMLDKITWDQKKKSKRKKIMDLDHDQHGIN